MEAELFMLGAVLSYKFGPIVNAILIPSFHLSVNDMPNELIRSTRLLLGFMPQFMFMSKLVDHGSEHPP